MADFQIIDGLESRLSVNNVGDEYFTTWDTDVTIKHTGGGGNNYPDVIEREWKLEVVNGDVLLELTVDINPNEQDNNAENWTFDLNQFAAGYTDGDVLMSISCHSTWIGRSDNGGTSENEYSSEPFLFYVIEDGSVVSAEEEYQGIPQYENFYANIVSVSNNNLEIANTWQEGLNGIIATGEYPKTGINPASTINNWTITYKSNDKRDLNTYLHFGDDNLLLTTNVISDNETFPNSPNSVIYKLYEPLPDDVNEKSMGYIVDEILPEIEDTVELFAYDQEDEEFQVLIPRESLPEDSPITERSTNLQSYTDLVTNNSKLKVEIEDKFLIKKPAELSVDYSNYENFVNFSSAEKRLKNFKYKLQQIEKNTALSASFVGVTNGNFDLEKHVTEIRNIKNNFDGYEKYLYNIKSTYASSSIGVFQDASWPKVGSGTYADPYKPVSSSNADFISWYGSVSSKTGQIYSASFYDQQNGNRLVNLLPEHISSDLDNTQFLDFMDMAGQQFDELWSYIKSMSDITDRRLDLNEGFSKDLVFSLAKSLGWDTQDGKDLLDLSRYGFGQKLSGDSYSLYTSGSLSSPVEADVSKEITKRLIASMPFILKSKGTEASIKAILNCYGIPSTILKVREFGGLDTSTQRAPFETKRRFTKALGFRSAQFVSSSWTDDIVTSRKPETVEMRFRSVSGSDQVLLQKDNDWAIKLKDNGSIDNYGTVAFALSGSDGYHEVSSSLLTVFDGEYHSLMLTKEKTNQQLFPNPDFETSALFSPPFETDTNNVNNGTIKIVSSSASAFSLYGTRSLEHVNTSNMESPKVSSTPYTQSLADVSLGERYTFSAYARVSGSTVDSVGRLRIYELDSNGNVVNWNEDSNWTYPSITDNGGIKSSDVVGLTEAEWKKIKVNKTIRFSNTSKLGVSFENLKAESTIFWDAANLRKLSPNNDSIHDSYDYTLYVKKYEAGLDRIIQSSVASLTISGSNTATSSYNAAWTGSGELFIGGKASSVFGNQLTGSLMEFRLWNEPLKEQLFDVHVSDPKSYVGNTPSSSYESLVVRYSFDDNTNLSDGTDIRDVSSNQTITVEGYPIGFDGLNTFESVVDETKTIVPNYGPNRRTSDKIRIENNFLSGSGASLNTTQRFDFSSNDFSPVDSPKVGIYFSPTDTVNDDILASFANIDFNQLLGDPRDNFKTEYPELKESANKYFQKYTGKNDFWDYMRLIKYYDQSIFKQFKKLLPMRAKPQMGTVIEPNIFERSKNPIQRNNPSFTQIDYQTKINVTNFHHNVDNDGVNQEASHSLLKISTEYPVYEGELDKQVFRFDLPSLYKFAANDNFDDRNLYISGSAKYGTPDYVYQEPTGAMVINQRLSEHNQEYKFFYNSAEDWAKSSLYSIDPHVNFYNSKSLYTSDKDTSYQHTLAFRRLFYEGVKNTSDTTIDGDLPFIVTSTAPTVAVPTNSGISKLSIDQSGNKRIIARPVNNTESSNNNNSE
tara:strand:+ start:5882 stop:10303 length:4422 start_codon:yes stop_codon:yes gene_type:complete